MDENVLWSLIDGLPAAEASGLMAVAGVWMWHAADRGHQANHCIDSARVICEALDQFGVSARLEPVAVEIETPHAHARHGTTRPYWNADGTYNGHVIVYCEALRRFVDASLHQYPEMPRGGLHGVPLMGLLPPGVEWGQYSPASQREDCLVVYDLAESGYRGSWNSGPVPAAAEKYHEAGVNLASNVFEMMRTPELRAKLEGCAAFPRLQHLYRELADAPAVVRGANYYFRTRNGEQRLDAI